MLDTPKRVAKLYDEIFSGYGKEEVIQEIFSKIFLSDNDQMVIVKDIDYYSNCEHHVVPFFGKVHIGYIPNGRVLGLSKFARITDIFSKRLQIQEQLTYQIGDCIAQNLKPLGVIVVVEGVHMCMCSRGVQKQNSKTITSWISGAFKENSECKQEFLNLIKC